jgi:hypothetical protein
LSARFGYASACQHVPCGDFQPAALGFARRLSARVSAKKS